MPGKEQQTADRREIRYNAVRVRVSQAEDQAALERELQALAKEIVSGLSVLGPAKSKDLLGTFVSDLFLSVAEEERRETRRQKQAEGIAAAKAQGVRFGAPRKPLPGNFDECHRKWREGELTMLAAAAACGMPKSSFYAAAVRKEQSA